MDALKPSVSLLSKLGSIVVHVGEATSKDAHEFDWVAIRQLLSDEEVRAWIEAMDKMAFLPKMRNTGKESPSQGAGKEKS